jgi:hypothetical protein
VTTPEYVETLLCDRCDHPYKTRARSSPVCIRCAVAADSIHLRHGWADPFNPELLRLAADAAARREDRLLAELYRDAGHRRGERRRRYARHLKLLHTTER